MFKRIKNKILDNLGNLIWIGLCSIVWFVVKYNDPLCSFIVSTFKSYPRAVLSLIILLVLIAIIVLFFLNKRVRMLKKQNAEMLTSVHDLLAKVHDLEDPMRNLVLADGSSIYKDTEVDRFVCPVCFTKYKNRSFLERSKGSDYQYEAYIYKCYVCDFCVSDITLSDKQEAAAKRGDVSAYHNRVNSYIV